MTKVLEILHLTCGYPRGFSLQDICLDLEAGELMVMVGPNGSGKSTLLRTLLREVPVLEGEVRLCGKPLGAYSAKSLARTMALLAPGGRIPEGMRCGEVVALGRAPHTGLFGRLGAADRSQVEAAMEMTRCRSLEREPFDRVSDGQRQLVRLARALCQQPRVLLLDEPTSFLDVRYKLRLLEILRELVRERKLAVLMSVHELDIALKAPDRVLLLEGGRQLALSSPEDLARGNQVPGLFGLSGGFVPEYACLEPAFAKGEPQVFVAGRQGALGAYRLLSRRGIPFACGVLEEGDLVCPAARVLASRVVTAAERDTLPEVLDGIRQIWLLPDADEETERWVRRCGIPVLQRGD